MFTQNLEEIPCEVRLIGQVGEQVVTVGRERGFQREDGSMVGHMGLPTLTRTGFLIEPGDKHAIFGELDLVGARVDLTGQDLCHRGSGQWDESALVFVLAHVLAFRETRTKAD